MFVNADGNRIKIPLKWQIKIPPMIVLVFKTGYDVNRHVGKHL